MKISVLTGHLFFKWSKSYASNKPEADLLHRIVALEKQKKCIEGKISRQDFDVFYLSAGASLTPAPLPLLKVRGNIENTPDGSIIKISTTLVPLAKYLFLISSIIIVSLYLIDKFVIAIIENFSGTFLPLIAPVFFFFFLKILFISESDSCDRFFRLVAEA